MIHTQKDQKVHSYKKVTRIITIMGTLLLVIVLFVVGVYNVNIQPFKAFGGVVWLKEGVHYLNDTTIEQRISEIVSPKEQAIAEKIKASTPNCGDVENGFCQKTPGEYVYKRQAAAAVAYKPGTPDKKELIGYCTLCNDGTLSPSCAVGRGACSWHGGVSTYNYPEYRIIPGTPEVKAQPATYTYTSKSYKDSLIYDTPPVPTLIEAVRY